MDRFRFGRSVRELRLRQRVTQAELGARVRVSRNLIGRIERGTIAGVPFGRLVAVAEALDGRLDLDFRWRGLQLDRLVNERHAGTVDQLVDVSAMPLARRGEATFSTYAERGSIDAFAWHPVRQVVAVNVSPASPTDAT